MAAVMIFRLKGRPKYIASLGITLVATLEFTLNDRAKILDSSSKFLEKTRNHEFLWFALGLICFVGFLYFFLRKRPAPSLFNLQPSVERVKNWLKSYSRTLILMVLASVFLGLWSQDAKRFAQLNPKGHPVKNDLALTSSPEGLADIFKLKHCLFRFFICCPEGWYSAECLAAMGTAGSSAFLEYPKIVKGMGSDFGFIMSNCGINLQGLINHSGENRCPYARKRSQRLLSNCFCFGNNGCNGGGEVST